MRNVIGVPMPRLACEQHGTGLRAEEMMAFTSGIQALVAVAGEGEYLLGAECENADRSALAAQVLCDFAVQTGLARSGASADTIMVDLVTDMMHLCERLDIDFPGVIRVAEMHHADEVNSAVCT